MALGSEEIALVEFDVRGRPYPAHSKSNDAWFQHCAIVVRDMNAAYAQLRSQGGWQPISSDGPQQLPAANGGVKAFKFRDPDGHPLELLWFPPGSGRAIWQDAERHAASLDAEQRVGRARDDAGQRAGRARHDAAALFLGIDHTALAIASTRASLDFYGSLGFRLSARSFNHGVAQAHLDGLTPSEARVRIAALRPASSEGPGIELLAYRPPASGRPGPGLPARGGGRASAATPQDGAGPAAAAAHAWSAALADQATDWITVLAATPGSGAQQPASHLASAPLPSASESPRRYAGLRDPDGHRLVLSMALSDPITLLDASGCCSTSARGSGTAPSMINPSPPTKPKFLRNSQKCSSPAPSWNRQKSANRQN
jgi:catechol 2,3-dioxygenase-like lactoylglutathione lyase family enzyme